MGNHHTDGYFIEAPANSVAALKRSYTYYWIDSNVHLTLENRSYLQVIRQLVPIVAFDRWEQLSSAVNSINPAGQPKICIMSSSSLSQEAYAWMQGQKKINKVVLFCSSRERALPLLEAYPKIQNYFTNLQDVISEIRTMQSEQTHSLHFFCKDDINRLNQWMHNWFALQLGGRQRGKQDFKALINAISGTQDMKKFDKQYNIHKNQGERQAMVLQWIKANNFFLEVTSEMLAKVRNTFALALIRLPFFDIYNSIKTSYAQRNYPDMTVFTRISLNSQELSRLRAGGFRYIYFSTFVVCDTDPGRQSTYKNEFRVTLILKQKPNRMEYMGSSGFYFDQDTRRVFLNIDIPFQVLQIDFENRQLQVQLVHLPKFDVEHPAQLARLQLHRKFIRYIGKIIPEQLLPAYHNEQLSLYNHYLQRQIQQWHNNTNLEVPNRKCLRILQMARLNLYYNLESEQYIHQEVDKAKELSHIITHNNSIGAKIKIYLLFIEIHLRMGDFIKFEMCLDLLSTIYQQYSENFTEEQQCQYKVYGVYCYVATNNRGIQQNLEKVNQIQLIFNSRQRQDAKVSKLYFIIMITKIKCEQLLGNSAKAYALFDQLLQNIQTCQGKNKAYHYYESLKEDLRGRQLRKTTSAQKQQIKKRVVSEVAVSELSTEPLAIKFSIDGNLFGNYDYSQYFD